MTGPVSTVWPFVLTMLNVVGGVEIVPGSQLITPILEGFNGGLPS